MALLSPVCATAEQLPIKTYTIADGLAHNSVNQIVRDSHGYLWFCTGEGVSRFNGYEFVNYGVDQGLPPGPINALLEARDGTYWLGTRDGLRQYNFAAIAPSRNVGERGPLGSDDLTGAQSRVVVYHLPDEDARSQDVLALFQDSDGVIWCGTKKGLFQLKMSQGRWNSSQVEIPFSTTTILDAAVWALAEDRERTLWIGGSEGLFRRWPDGRVEAYGTAEGLPPTGIGDLFRDHLGRLWASTRLGLYRLVLSPIPGRSIVERAYTAKNGLLSDWVNSVFESSDGTLWIGTPVGLNELNPNASGKAEITRGLTRAQGLSDDSIQAIVEDRGGNLWLGTESGGAMRMERGGFISYGKADGLRNDRVGALFEDQEGHLCADVATDRPRTLNCFDGHVFLTIPIHLPVGITRFGWGDHQVILQDHHGEWWIPTGQGLCRYPAARSMDQLGHLLPIALYTTRDGLLGDDIYRLFEDSHGDLWISNVSVTQPGLTQWERRSGTFHRYSLEEVLHPADTPTAFAEDRSGDLWIGLYRGGLLRRRRGEFELLTAEDGLGPGFIHDLHLDRGGRLWIATGLGGLNRVDEPDAEHPKLIRYGTVEGLSSNETHCITEDRFGNLYIGTGRGLDRLDPASGHIRHYSAQDGLARGIPNVAYRTRDGTIWVGTLQGLSAFHPSPETPTSAPRIVLNGIQVAGVALPIPDLGVQNIPELHLGVGQDDVQIEYLGLESEAGEELRYQYMLEGAESEWSRPSDQRRINFANLAPGTYRFQVRAVNSEGVSSLQPANVSFTIPPPIWQRWWVLASLPLFFATGAVAVHRVRVARLLELERVRTRIATDLHDDVGSSLSQIAVLSEVAQRQVGDSVPPAAEALTRIATVSRELVDSMSDIVWAINPRRDRLSELTSRMRRFASDVFTAREIEFTFRAPSQAEDVEVGADFRRQIYLIYKESINNSVRHSRCTKVEIHFERLSGEVVLRIADNGQGFDPSHHREGHGLGSLQARARALGGKIEIATRSGSGSTVTVRVPVEGPPSEARGGIIPT